ncbi:hypothetical protein HMPREF0083_03661 [Aneurinibacillus aneurinilyticus ATCC 12856]|uniref:Uncharacterized protein n=1 Tax=Aneurinibacillus aneurinilyticus ATCC 12856 TaxID=649747 RepID=U1YBS9_ANEAE|nr:hypothetical protein HMPREF0083_03661 [Aneurinibacillus aneurinilyticus ATCC 12856]
MMFYIQSLTHYSTIITSYYIEITWRSNKSSGGWKEEIQKREDVYKHLLIRQVNLYSFHPFPVFFSYLFTIE